MIPERSTIASCNIVTTLKYEADSTAIHVLWHDENSERLSRESDIHEKVLMKIM